MATMTMREFLKSAIEKFGAESEEGVFAQSQITKMDEKLAARKGKLTEAQKETAALAEQIVGSFEAGVVYTASQVGADFGVSTQKASAILRKAAEAGTLVQSEVKIKASKAEGIKGGKVKGYALAESVETEIKGEGEGEGEG